MQTDKSHKGFFTIAAIWNWSAAVLFIYMALFNNAFLGYFLKIIPENFLWYHLFLVLVFSYGLGYYWTGNDPVKNRDIIKMGIFAKILVFILLIGGWLKGVITILVAGAGVVDLVFAILFLRLLIKL